MYFRAVFEHLFGGPLRARGSFHHFFHWFDAFEAHGHEHTVASISGHALDLDRYGDVRVSRIVRDPRDLVVSGYWYHRRSGEGWCDVENPTWANLEQIGGVAPAALPRHTSLAAYLRGVSVEEGLLAELDFRRLHFASMMQWPDADPRVLVLRYEEVVGDDVAAIDRLMRFFELSPWLRLRARYFAAKYSARRRFGRDPHIRDPRAGQWREHFTDAVRRRFDELYPGLVEKLGYPAR